MESESCYMLQCSYPLGVFGLLTISAVATCLWGAMAVRSPQQIGSKAGTTRTVCHPCSACSRTIALLVRAQWAEEACTRADPPSVQALRQGVSERVAAAGGRVDYVEVPHILELMCRVKLRVVVGRQCCASILSGLCCIPSGLRLDTTVPSCSVFYVKRSLLA